MNFLQSFWSLPTFKHNDDDYNRFRGGWVNEKHNAVSWVLSLNLLKKYNAGKKVILYTDKQGENWLVNQLALDYDEVKPELDVINHLNPILWAAGKIYVYSKQEEPFLHLDNDFFYWKSFESKLLSKKIIGQNFESGHKIYTEIMEDMLDFDISFPASLANINPGKESDALNAGIFGGNDIDLIKAFSGIAFDFINRNQEKIVNSNMKGAYNMLFEQLFAYRMTMARYGSLNEVGTLLEENAGGQHLLTRFWLVPTQCQYIHLGTAKANVGYVHHMQQRLKYEFPKAAQHLDTVYPEATLYYLLGTLPKRYFGASPDFSKEQPFFAARLQLKALGIPFTEVTEQYLEELLAEHFDNPNYYPLWDIYQIESSGISKDKLLEADGHNQWNLIYDYTPDDFMNIPFRLNHGVCRIIYLYHDWKGGLFQNDIRAFATGETRLPLDASKNLFPWLISQSHETIHLFKLEGWFSLLSGLDVTPRSGNEILAHLESNNQYSYSYSSQSLKEDLYFFLTSQFSMYYRIMPATGQLQQEQE